MKPAHIYDAFLYCALYCPDRDLLRLYEDFVYFLVRHDIDPLYDQFLDIFLPAKLARSASSIEQSSLLEGIELHPFFINHLR